MNDEFQLFIWSLKDSRKEHIQNYFYQFQQSVGSVHDGKDYHFVNVELMSKLEHEVYEETIDRAKILELCGFKKNDGGDYEMISSVIQKLFYDIDTEYDEYYDCSGYYINHDELASHTIMKLVFIFLTCIIFAVIIGDGVTPATFSAFCGWIYSFFFVYNSELTKHKF